jgi:hypothetical protein
VSREKKVIQAYVPRGVKASELFRFRKVPAYDNPSALKPRMVISRRRTEVDVVPVKITVEVLDK